MSVTPAEWFRLGLMLFFTAVIAFAIFSPFFENLGKRGKNYIEEKGPVIKVPNIEIDQKILEEIRDDVPRARVRREPKAFQHLLYQASRLVPGSLEYLGLPKEPLDYEKVLKNPKAYRGKPVWVKARLVDDLLVLPSSLKGVKDVRGKAKDAKGRLYFFSMAQPPKKPLRPGDWVKIKGFFYKLWDPDANGSKVPYIIGLRLYPSWPEWKPVKELDPALFHKIMDGSTIDPEETEPEVFYHFLSYVMNLDEKAKDPANVEMLSDKDLTGFKNNPKGNRGKLVRFYAKVLYNPDIRAADENPINLDKITRFWVGTSRPPAVIRLIAPRARTDIFKGMEIEVVGCFLRNLEYNPKGQSIGKAVAPIIIAAKILIHEYKEDRFWGTAKWILVGILIAAILLLFGLSVYDRKKHQLAEKEMIKRRKERLARKLGAQREKKGE